MERSTQGKLKQGAESFASGIHLSSLEQIRELAIAGLVEAKTDQWREGNWPSET